MEAANQDSATRDGAGGITQRVKDYCTQAVANLKAGRFKQAYLFVNEALELDEKDARTAALYRHVLYALHPKKRLLDKAKALHEEVDQCIDEEDYGKALELLSLAKKWHCTPGLLYARSNLNVGRIRFDLAYVDLTEGLAESTKDKVPFAASQRTCLPFLGYRVLPVTEPDPFPGPNEMPVRYHVSNWPQGLRIDYLIVHRLEGYAEAMKTDGTMLKPHVPLNQLAPFLNHHVQGAVQKLVFNSSDGVEGEETRLLDEVTVAGRLHVDLLSFFDFFLLPWAGIKRILNGRSLRANTVDFLRLQLPSGVDANKLLQLPTISECTRLRFLPYSRLIPQLPGRPPLFNNTALLEWIKRNDGRWLQLTHDYLSSGLLSFVDALKTDFKQPTQVHSFVVTIHCPHMDVGARLGVRNEEFSNPLGERMWIVVGEDLSTTAIMGDQFETVIVRRLTPS